MNPTPHKHKALIDQWSAAPEWWDVYRIYENGTRKLTWGSELITYNNHEFELRKSAKHPDNKPKKRLIDWSRMPRGTMTNHGEFLCVPNGITGTKYLSVMNSNFYVFNALKSEIRLAEQTKFTYWGGGECPVPEGVVVEVVFREGLKQICEPYSWKHSDQRIDSGREVIAYRITGLAEGFTDNPEEAV